MFPSYSSKRRAVRVTIGVLELVECGRVCTASSYQEVVDKYLHLVESRNTTSGRHRYFKLSYDYRKYSVGLNATGGAANL